MADSTTTSYGFTKPGVGASAETWGGKLNANWDKADDCFDGTQAISPNLALGDWQVGGVTVNVSGSELNKLDGLSGTPLTDADSDTLTKGFSNSTHNAGTQTGGTFTPDPLSNNLQRAVNGGAFTLAPPASDCSIVVQITNNTSAGAISTSGFNAVRGDTLTTTNGDDFMCFIVRVNGFSVLNVVALQ